MRVQESMIYRPHPRGQRRNFCSVALSIICVLPTGCGGSGHAEATARYQLGQVERFIHQWEEKHSRLPSSGIDGLRVIGELIPNPDGVNIVLRDPWQHWLVYRVPSTSKGCRFDLYSMGPNGIYNHGENDDIVLDEAGHRPGCP
jgi:hypothetical protein